MKICSKSDVCNQIRKAFVGKLHTKRKKERKQKEGCKTLDAHKLTCNLFPCICKQLKCVYAYQRLLIDRMASPPGRRTLPISLKTSLGLLR